MTDRMRHLLDGVLPEFLAGMAVNFQIAAIALVVGLALGLLLAGLRQRGGIGGAAAVSIIALMRAAPTFVVMFFLLNAVPRDAALFGIDIALSGVMTVALSLVPYSAAYVADAGFEAWRQWRAGSALGALLFLPNVTRAFFVLVMSSGAGAAVGVNEGIAVLLREAGALTTLGEKLALFAVGIFCFGAVLQAGFALMTVAQRSLSRLALRRTGGA